MKRDDLRLVNSRYWGGGSKTQANTRAPSIRIRFICPRIFLARTSYPPVAPLAKTDR
jgi:hypothetical protein